MTFIPHSQSAIDFISARTLDVLSHHLLIVAASPELRRGKDVGYCTAQQSGTVTIRVALKYVTYKNEADQ